MSFTALERILTAYAKISGYKINKEKSVIMGINISEKIKKKLVQMSNATW